MDLFSRTVSTVGPPADVMAFATDMTAFVSDKLGQEVALWAMGFGAPAGTIGWTARIDGLAGVSAMQATLMEDPEYHAKLGAGRDFVAAPATDQLGSLIHGELGDPPPVGSVAAITSAVIGNGKYAEAVAWGIDMADHAGSVTGVPTNFMMSRFGTFGAVTWIGVSADAAAADAAGAALESDAAYIEKLGAVGDLFVPASGNRSVATRVA
jgi:hypothetical protein